MELLSFVIPILVLIQAGLLSFFQGLIAAWGIFL